MTQAAVWTPGPAGVPIKPASSRDITAIAETLADAFYADPVFRWCAPDDERRRAMLTPFFGTFARAIQPAGGAYDASGIGAALWSPPGVPVVEPERAEDFGQALADACGEDADRVFQVAGMIDEHAPAGSYYYLHFLGVRAERQGQGIGSALLREVLTHCDARGIPAYLDATSEDNRRLYERHGFVVREAYSPRGCPPLFAMWREPRS